MWLLVFLVFFVLGVLSLRRVRWAYITFVLLGLLFFPRSTQQPSGPFNIENDTLNSLHKTICY
ncbi:MAG TPA: hypothetical protein DCK93_09905 [Blastocatellia bacterium]|jgi:hypothetical protein|nr:hypothetical protein [Blastocatellia bacterium]HAF23205.1 hypothetical protein [Blastocatellia bacterium]